MKVAYCPFCASAGVEAFAGSALRHFCCSCDKVFYAWEVVQCTSNTPTPLFTLEDAQNVACDAEGSGNGVLPLPLIPPG